MEYKMGVKLADDGLDRRRRKSAIRRDAIKFTKIVSLVGIRHATDACNSVPRRFVWVAWLVIGFGFAIYQIQERIIYYSENPSVTEFKMIVNETMLLPQITICNENEIVTSKSREFGFQSYTRELNDSLIKLEAAKKQNDSNALQDAQTAMDLVIKKVHNFTKDWKNLSKNLTLTKEEAIIAVTFNETKDRSLIEEVVTDLGHCFAFSTKNRPLSSSRAGPSGGLFLVLSVSRKDYAHEPNFAPGYRMLIHDSDEIPRIKEGVLSLKPGMVTRVAVSLEDVLQQGPPHGSCYANVSDYKEKDCLTKSDYESFISRCGCKDRDFKKLDPEKKNASDEYDGFPACSYADFYNCTVVHSELFQKTANEANCDRTQCYSRIYETKETLSAFPMLMNEPPSSVQGDSQTLDRIRVYVYYEQLIYREAHNIPDYSFLQLLIDIGGALSLLLGATLLTVYEAGEFLLLFARDYLHMRLGK